MVVESVERLAEPRGGKLVFASHPANEFRNDHAQRRVWIPRLSQCSIGRIEKGFNVYPECKANFSESPCHYLKRVWMDSICYYQDILLSSYAYSEADKIMMRSDFPHQITDLEKAVERIKRMDINDEEKCKILGKTP